MTGKKRQRLVIMVLPETREEIIKRAAKQAVSRGQIVDEIVKNKTTRAA